MNLFPPPPPSDFEYQPEKDPTQLTADEKVVRNMGLIYMPDYPKCPRLVFGSDRKYRRQNRILRRWHKRQVRKWKRFHDVELGSADEESNDTTSDDELTVENDDICGVMRKLSIDS